MIIPIRDWESLLDNALSCIPDSDAPTPSMIDTCG